MLPRTSNETRWTSRILLAWALLAPLPLIAVSADPTISGNVVDASGRPVAGVPVYLGNRALVDRFHTPLTDSHGRFSFQLIASGRSDVWADMDGATWAWARDVEAGAANVRLVLEPARQPLTFAGLVVEADGKPAARSVIHPFRVSSSGVRLLDAYSADAAGSFSFEVASVPHQKLLEILLVARSPDGRIIWKTVPGCGGSDIHLRFKAAASITGRVLDPQGRPAAGARVWLDTARDPDAGEIHFFDVPPPPTAQTQTDAKGAFTLSGLPLGCSVTIAVKHPTYEHAFVSGLPRFGLPHAELQNIHANTRLADAVRLRQAAAMSGTVRYADTGKPAAGARITITIPASLIASTTTDQNGHYRIEGLDYEYTPTQIQPTPIMRATIGDPPQWEGHYSRDRRLKSGETATDCDIVLHRAPDVSGPDI
ncbi:MAG TPA: carboxypeptidase-like regulatory domain-containing protein [Tepidisphaeraceae bacterium]|nr:carboxypeptidase-like regulatory domain-containing protein [Tepidisphaeraceae bacterium]